MQVQTVLEAYEQFSQSEACQLDRRLLDNLRTTLRRYVLPAYGRFDLLELRKNLEGCLAQVPLIDLLNDAAKLLKDLKQSGDRGNEKGISRATATNYRSALLRFFNWVYAQGWEHSQKAVAIPDFAPSLQSGQGLPKVRQTASRNQTFPYSLRAEDLSGKIKEQLAQLEAFLAQTAPTRPDHSPLSEDTIRAYRESLLCLLGWHAKVVAIDISELDLEQVIQIDQLTAFVDWGCCVRENSDGWATNIVTAALAAARWLSSLGKEPPDQDEIQVLQHKFQSEYQSGTRASSSPYEESHKSGELTYEESQQIVKYLKECCAPCNRTGIPRSETAIIRAWQRYLIAALLLYTPIRQREIRKLEHPGTLVREEDGYYVRSSASSKAKQRNTHGDTFRIPAHLTADLDYWVKTLRRQITTEHQYVFIRLGSGRTPENLGQPLTERDTSSLLVIALSRAATVLFGFPPMRITPQAFRQYTTAHLNTLQPTEPLHR
ncbi:MAG TPA: hypothetical protein V6D29_05115 [Leptolyngbyaceae cyanobacterium]